MICFLFKITQVYKFDTPISTQIQLLPDMVLERSEVVNGVACNKWTKVFDPNPDNYVVVSTWVTTDGLTPVQMFSSVDNSTGSATGGLKYITYFSPTVSDSDFIIPAACHPTK